VQVRAAGRRPQHLDDHVVLVEQRGFRDVLHLELVFFGNERALAPNINKTEVSARAKKFI
jgi:hypothetical protein